FCSVAASRHEALVAHAIDSAGRVVHAQALVGHHDGPSDVHARTDGDHDECTIVTALHQAARASAAHVLAATPQTAPITVAMPSSYDRVGAVVYRLAPKTSPPADRAS